MLRSHIVPRKLDEIICSATNGCNTVPSGYHSTIHIHVRPGCRRGALSRLKSPQALLKSFRSAVLFLFINIITHIRLVPSTTFHTTVCAKFELPSSETRSESSSSLQLLNFPSTIKHQTNQARLSMYSRHADAFVTRPPLKLQIFRTLRKPCSNHSRSYG